MGLLEATSLHRLHLHILSSMVKYCDHLGTFCGCSQRS